MAEHRWSGWPGAWCLDCGVPDPMEICLAVHPEVCLDSSQRYCPDHVETSCPEPNSLRHDPYREPC